MGLVSIGEKKFDEAIAHLDQANQQNASVLYPTALAHRGNGDEEKATEMSKRAANMNVLPAFNYAFIRAKAKNMAGAL
jgi:hypothetical protein